MNYEHLEELLKANMSNMNNMNMGVNNNYVDKPKKNRSALILLVLLILELVSYILFFVTILLVCFHECPARWESEIWVYLVPHISILISLINAFFIVKVIRMEKRWYHYILLVLSIAFTAFLAWGAINVLIG